MTKACYNCKYEENSTDEKGELTEPCLTCVNYSNFIASEVYQKIIDNMSSNTGFIAITEVWKPCVSMV